MGASGGPARPAGQALRQGRARATGRVPGGALRRCQWVPGPHLAPHPRGAKISGGGGRPDPKGPHAIQDHIQDSGPRLVCVRALWGAASLSQVN